ncbi:MAG: hypothetical protein OXQ29_15160 [Rhodospirillaceae bacterium]|nr:hypothetical protein [Rhodospirillaceae bacterium]
MSTPIPMCLRARNRRLYYLLRSLGLFVVPIPRVDDPHTIDHLIVSCGFSDPPQRTGLAPLSPVPPTDSPPFGPPFIDDEPPDPPDSLFGEPVRPDDDSNIVSFPPDTDSSDPPA